MDERVIERVRSIVENSGLTHRDVAALLGLDPSKLSKSLNGVRRFSSYELASAAELGGRTVDWILTGEERTPLRFAHRTVDPSVLAIEDGGRERALSIAERHEDARALGILPSFVDLPVRSVSSSYMTQAEEMASAAVARIGSPLHTLSWPVLIRSIEESFGIHVAVEQLSAQIDGMSMSDGDLRLAIVSTADRPGRQRFTLAHELGHILFADAGQEVIEEQLFTVKSMEESRADAFAARVLMPQKEILELVSGRTPTEAFSDLVWEFRVSPKAMAWRLKNVGLIDGPTCEALLGATESSVARELNRFDEHRARIGEALAMRAPGRLADAYIGAFLDGSVGAAPVADISGLPIETIRRLLDEVEYPDTWPNPPAIDGSHE